MKKILLIGKNGQLASELIKDANTFEFDVVAFSKKDVDVTKVAQIQKKIKEVKPDFLINTSAYHILPKCEENPLAAMEVNFIAVQNLAKTCKEKNIPFVTYSTDYVFDGEKGAPYEENDNPHPLQLYGLSKLAGECAALYNHPEGAFVIRTCGLYGGERGSPEKDGNFVLNMMKEARQKETINVSSEQIVSPTYAGDISRATLKLLKNRASPGLYHLINEGSCSWFDFAKEIFQLAEIDKKLEPINRGGMEGKMRRPKFSALKNTKAKRVGIELPPWQEGLKSYFIFLNLPNKIAYSYESKN